MPLPPAHARRLREIRESYDDLLQAREDAIVEAWKAGGGMREIADEIGMSHVGVSKMLQRLGLRTPWTTLDAEQREDEERRRARKRR